MTLNAEGNTFRRNLVTGFTVVPTDVQPLVAVKTPKIALNNYPNPARVQTNITLEVIEKAASHLSLYDAYGRLVRTENLSNLDLGTHTLQWNIADLANGNYFLEWNNGQHKVTRSLVKVAE